MGTQKVITQAFLHKKADYILARKGNQSGLHDDVRRFWAARKLAKTCGMRVTTDCGHGRIEEQTSRAAEDIAWHKERHPAWQGLRSIVAITAARTARKTR